MQSYYHLYLYWRRFKKKDILETPEYCSPRFRSTAKTSWLTDYSIITRADVIEGAHICNIVCMRESSSS